ncbi:S24 family peptidase [Mucilaginibacter gossypii]|uniref:S24 family peptidase n=1 Tax=Mucilaginibacter gossypii TaxID=551996 RepID=UPI00210B3889|nr:LexA family transcriptional regulator [Mucilaginibacter gossypii]
MDTLSENELQSLTAAGAGQPTGHDLRVLAITVNPQNEENVEFVPVKAKAGYRAGHRDPEYLASLPKFSFPDLPKGRTFRMFPTTGDSMLPIPEGSIVLASYVTDWLSIKADTRCILILNSEMEFVFKKVTVLKNNRLLLMSENARYIPYEVKMTEVLEIWEYDRFISQEIPERGTDLDEIKSMLGEMRRQLELR